MENQKGDRIMIINRTFRMLVINMAKARKKLNNDA